MFYLIKINIVFQYACVIVMQMLKYIILNCNFESISLSDMCTYSGIDIKLLIGPHFLFQMQGTIMIA
jgi:hypothetical protein